jgi:Spherulation-specific family 4
MSGFVCLNPGGPTCQRYFDLADLVIVAEHVYADFLNPPTQYDTYSYLLRTSSSYGRRLRIPRFTTDTPAQKMSVIIHGFPVNTPSKDDSLAEDLTMMIRDLVRVKKVGAVFFTDLDISKRDVYAAFGTIWEDFVAATVESGRPEAVEDIMDKNVEKICLKQGFVAEFIAKIEEMGRGKE